MGRIVIARRSVLLLAVVFATGLARGANVDAVAKLREGAEAQAAGRWDAAWRAYDEAIRTAASNYLRVEALARQLEIARPGSPEREAAAGRLQLYLDGSPPRWLTDPARKRIDELRGAAGAVRALTFPPEVAGSGFRGRRYLWTVPLTRILPAGVTDPGGRDVARDDDGLPGGRLPVGAGWAAVDPWHAQPNVPGAVQARWRYDRCLLGYTFEPVERRRNAFGRDVWTPLEPWYPVDGGTWEIWRLRFRVFYPTPAVGAARDYGDVAQALLDVLLRAHWIGRELYGREPLDAQQRPEILNVWLTENQAENMGEAGAERWFENLFFYQLRSPRGEAEWVREAVHEFGHTALPRLGRYVSAPSFETWLDGPWGERLFLDGLHCVEHDGGAAWPAALADGSYETYRREQHEPLVRAWLEAGPNAPQRYGLDDQAAAWILGFALWVAETHEPRFVYEYYRQLPTTGQVGADRLLAAYTARIRELERVRIAAGWPTLATGEIGRVGEGLRLAEKARAEYVLWLPAGPVDVRLLGPTRGLARLVDDAGERLLETGDALTAPAAAVLGKGEWCRLRVEAYGPQPLALEAIELRR